jgi:hypothetical protein
MFHPNQRTSRNFCSILLTHNNKVEERIATMKREVLEKLDMKNLEHYQSTLLKRIEGTTLLMLRAQSFQH